MLKETRIYEDYDGVERKEDFYFNLSKAELAEMELSNDGGLENYIQKIIDAKDGGKIIKVFKDLLLKAYGIKSDDGKRFIKSEEISKAFSETPVYSDMFMELATDDEKAARFVQGIIPKDLNAQVDKLNKEQGLKEIANAGTKN